MLNIYMVKLSTYLDLMACCSRRTFARELAHLGCCPSKQVSPSYLANVIGSRVLLAGILHSGKAPVLRVVESYHQSLDLPVRSFLHVHKFAPASVCEAVKGVQIVHQHNFTPYLQLKCLLKGGACHTSSPVGLEGCDGSAPTLCLTSEGLTLNLLQLGPVPAVHLVICSIDVQGIVVQTGIRFREDSRLQGFNIFLSVASCSNSVQ